MKQSNLSRIGDTFTMVQADQITYLEITVAEKCQGVYVLRYGLSRARKLTMMIVCDVTGKVSLHKYYSCLSTEYGCVQC